VIILDKKYKIFAINPGSTSTKIAMFENDKAVFSVNVSHDASKLKEFKEISDQLPYRKETILNELAKNNISLEGVDAFAARGGGLVGLEGQYIYEYSTITPPSTNIARDTAIHLSYVSM
jgi:butyrate kinase